MSDKELSEAFDCGAWARHRNLGRDMCPNYTQRELCKKWFDGYRAQPRFTPEQMNDLYLRKTGVGRT